MTGFTLTEILIVLGLVTVLTLVGLPAGIDEYIRSMRRADQELIVSALREARAQSLNNVTTNPDSLSSAAHGVYLTTNALTIFEGQSYASRYTPADITLSFSGTEVLSPMNSLEVVFEASSGDVPTGTQFSITGPDGYTETISVASDGTITS